MLSLLYSFIFSKLLFSSWSLSQSSYSSAFFICLRSSFLAAILSLRFLFSSFFIHFYLFLFFCQFFSFSKSSSGKVFFLNSPRRWWWIYTFWKIAAYWVLRTFLFVFPFLKFQLKFVLEVYASLLYKVIDLRVDG